MIAYEGATFASSLIAAGLIDEFHFIINPLALGNGIQLFDRIDVPLHCALLAQRHMLAA